MEKSLGGIRQELWLILPVSFCYGLIIAFFELMLFAAAMLAADSGLGQSIQRMNPFLSMIGGEWLLWMLLLGAWPLGLGLVLLSRTQAQS